MTQTGTAAPTTVLISPAMAVRSRVYRRLAEALAGYGLEVRVVARRASKKVRHRPPAPRTGPTRTKPPTSPTRSPARAPMSPARGWS
ncbi:MULTISPECIES: hypothetical protein [Gordonia]|uniref:Uncharacterized protein n=1 Tax=Gordonia amicalis TaxID=89053 RepID=A0AAE4R5M2_9ACTN|nr:MULTISPECIES: hypothetical protein [Gordonia]MCZ4653139.1 hypothetical protein [Gordonia amicalis]MDJ0451066.1 hypothetical protein [Gordonia amicalis]MDV6308796.1 hypothetical protein [Gordonia amicalis]MDV6313748.1 hypothetical protein [Gordonia amicalis]MDV7074446.1 hypothetical protein [Gordonia amicalis]